jgi:hypothetical protein
MTQDEGRSTIIAHNCSRACPAWLSQRTPHDVFAVVGRINARRQHAADVLDPSDPVTDPLTPPAGL